MFSAAACFVTGRSRSRLISCAQQTCFAERSFQKIVFQRQLSDLGMERLHVDGRRRASVVAARTCPCVSCPWLKSQLLGRTLTSSF
jgi:hypothetical protein